MDTITEEQLTLSLGDFRVKTFRQQVNKKALVENDPAYIPKCLELLASVCPDTQFLKTCQASLLETQVGGSQNFSMTWPRSGLMQNGTVSKLPTLAHRIDGTECGLLPTPNASDNRSRGDLSMPSVQRRIRIGKQVGLSTHFKGNPCPMCVEGMMGFPKGWTDLQD
tara:strand:+ start:34 stop:531 length:498 start_codon:yes stop_codon:yes gene_type:complete